MRLTNKQIRKIGKLIGVDFRKIPFKEFKMGIKEEFEHSDIIGYDPILSARIAHVHLLEHPRYYTILKEVFKALSS